MPDERDREVLRRVYQAQMDQWREEYEEAARQRDEALASLQSSQADYFEAYGATERLRGQMDGLRTLAAKDGVTLD